MKKTYKMALVSALALFSLSDAPLVLNDHQNVAQAAATKKTHHKKARKHTAKKKTTKKLRYKKAKKHVAKKKATRKFRYKKAKNRVTKKKFTGKLRYKKAKKVVAKKKTTKRHSYKKINHKKSRKTVSKKQNNSLANISDDKSQSNLNYNANSNPVENNTPTTSTNTTKESNSNSNIYNDYPELHVTNLNNPNNINIDDFSKALDSVKKDEKNGINPSISSNQSDIEKLAEFYEIIRNYKKDKKQKRLIAENNKHQANEAKKAAFNKILAKIQDDEKNGINPSISSNQSDIQKFAEFVEIMRSNKAYETQRYLDYDNNFNNFDNMYFSINKQIVSFNDVMNNNDQTIKFDPNKQYTYIPPVFEQVKDDKAKGVKPHISSDQSPEKQFAEFVYIMAHNEKEKLKFERKDEMFMNKDISFNVPTRTVTITDNDYPNGKTFNFDPNVKYYNNPFKEIAADEAKGITPHISSDQSPLKQLLEFRNIIVNNEKVKLSSELRDFSFNSFYNLPEKTVTLIGEFLPRETFNFNPDIQFIKYNPTKLELAANAVRKEKEYNDITPHISSDQSPEKQFAEFVAITIQNEKNILSSESQSTNISYPYDFNKKTVTLIDADNPQGKTLHFNLNTKLMEKLPNKLVEAFDEVGSESNRGIKPHISSDQSKEKQFAEFVEITVDNERNRISSTGDINDYVYSNYNFNKKTVTLYENNIRKTLTFDPNAKLDY